MKFLFSVLSDILKARNPSVGDHGCAVAMEPGINDLRQCRSGPMVFNRQDIYVGGSLAAYGEFSHGEMILFAGFVRPDTVVVEVGANIGAHTVGLSRLVGPRGRVYAFEPQRIVFQTLCANLALNQCVNVYASQMAVGDAEGAIVVPAMDYGEVANFGGVSLVNQNVEGEKVPLATLDGLNLPGCDFLKVDVEGMECEVLRGATDTIRKYRPIMYLENDREGRSAELISLVQSLGYRLWWHSPRLYSRDNFAGNKTDIFPGIVSINMVCLPAESADCENIDLIEIRDPADKWNAKDHE